MKIRTLIVVGNDVEFYSQIQELVNHHPHLAPAGRVKDRSLLKSTLEAIGEPLILIERVKASESTPQTLQSYIPMHLKDQCIIANVLFDLEVNGKTEADFLLQDGISYLQFEKFVENASQKVVRKIENRFSSALTILAEEVGAQLDQVAYLRRKGYKAEVSEIVLQDMKSAIHGLNGKEKAQFFGAFAQYCESAEPFTEEFTVRKRYVGVSTRVRKNMSSKAQTKFDQATMARNMVRKKTA